MTDPLPLATILAWWCTLVAVGWLLVRLDNTIALTLTPTVRPYQDRPDPAKPLVSVLVPARNEADRILPECLGSLLRQSHANIEVIAVNDRSTDATLDLLRAAAEADSRLQVIDGAALPDGWRGKPHAMQQAWAAAQGDWILCTDADVVFHPRAIGAALAVARAQGLDFLTLIPRTRTDVPSMNIIMPAAGWMILHLFPPLATANPHDPRALGCGGFMLLRREVLEQLGGYEPLAATVVDDVGLARLVKAAGFRMMAAMAPELIWTPMYNNLQELWAGFSKNAFQGVRESVALALLALLANLSTAVLPPLLGLALLAATPWGLDAAWEPVRNNGLLAWAAMAWAFWPVYRQHGAAGGYALAVPLAFLTMSGVLVNATVRGLLNRPVPWRDKA